MTRPSLSALAAEVEVLETEIAVRAEHARQVAQAELELARAKLAVLRRDLLAGLPANATRGLHPWELRARVNFAAIEEGIEELRARIARRLHDDRQAFADLVERDLAEHADRPAQVIRRLEELELAGLLAITGAEPLITDAVAWHRAALGELALKAAARVRQEAADQGVDLDAPSMLAAGAVPELPADLDDRLDRQARRLATGPHGDALRAAREEAVRVGPTGDPASSSAAAIRGMSERGLDDYANTAAIDGEGAGREHGVRTIPAEPLAVYASELLDGNTCRPCSWVDGTEYPSVEASLEDYPEGRFRECEGGPRCRGTRVFVWAEGDEEGPSGPGDVGPDTDGPDEPPAPEPASWDAELAQVLTDLDATALDPITAQGEALKVADDTGAREVLVPGPAVEAAEEALTRAGAIIEGEAQRRAGPMIAEAERAIPALEEARDVAERAYNDVKAVYFDTPYAERAAMRDRLNATSDELHQARRALSEARERVATAAGRARLEVLGEAREMGGAIKLHRTRLAKPQRAWVETAQAHYPASWVARSNAVGPVRVSYTSKRRRASYRDEGAGGGLIEIDYRAGSSVTTHELGHRMEATTPELGVAQWAFLRRRAGREPLRPFREMSPGTHGHYARVEVGRRDEARELYTFREYGPGNRIDRNYEVLTTGMEGVFAGRTEMLLDRTRPELGEDTDLVHFILGTLVGIP